MVISWVLEIKILEKFQWNCQATSLRDKMKYFSAQYIVYFWISQPGDVYTKSTNKTTFARSQHGY